jgi:hypothetical protein
MRANPHSREVSLAFEGLASVLNARRCFSTWRTRLSEEQGREVGLDSLSSDGGENSATLLPGMA